MSHICAVPGWPRVHTCLYNWCPRQHEECKRCDAVCAVIRSAFGGLASAAQKGAETTGSSATRHGLTRKNSVEQS